jgi:homoserine kinase type II
MRTDLAALLADHHATHQPIGAIESVTGGLSGAELWRYESASGLLVARAWPATVAAERVATVHSWLAEASALPFVPMPIADRQGRTWGGHAGRVWELMPWMSGSSHARRPPDAAKVRAAFAGLAAFHARLGRLRYEDRSTGLVQRETELRALVQGAFASIQDRLNGPVKDVGLEWLARAWRLAPTLLELTAKSAPRIVPVQPCLRDARPAHFLFDGDELTGLIDYGAMGVESVAADLARLLGEWIGDERPLRGVALAAYESVRPLEARELALIDVFERSSGLLIGAHWLARDVGAGEVDTVRERIGLSLRSMHKG